MPDPDFLNENISPSVTQETDAALVSLGQRGAVVSDGVATGNFAAIQCITDCTFDELTTIRGDGEFSFFVNNATIIPAGTIIYGCFTVIGSTNGTYVAYRA
jgi:hypothetical protein